MQYSQDLKEHLAAEKQIAAARAGEVAMASVRVDPQILEEHLAIEDTIDASRTADAMRLAVWFNSAMRCSIVVGAFCYCIPCEK